MGESERPNVDAGARRVSDDYYANWKHEWVRDGDYIRCYARIDDGQKRGQQLYSFEVAKFRTIPQLEEWLWSLQEKTWIEKWDLAKLVSLFKEANH